MKKPVVDYREFRLSKINDPRFSHLKLLMSWIIYFLSYILTERLISEESCRAVHCFLDDVIPFCEYFVIPYVFWYAFVVGSLLYFLLYNVDSFKKLQIFIIITQITATVIYIVFPNKQMLRPEIFPRENIFTALVGRLYLVDTNTNVCPSLHCAYSIAIASVWMKEKGVPKGVKAMIAAAAFIICISTAFIKQHSVVDFFAAIPVCILAEFLLYGRSYISGFKERKRRLREKQTESPH